MTYTITATGTGDEDDVRAAFGELVGMLRAAGDTSASLVTSSATYTQDDVPDVAEADDEPDEDGQP